MNSTPTALTADSSITTWLEHPIGGAVIRKMLTDGGQSEGALNPVRRLALKRLVKLSHGKFNAEMIDDLIRQVTEATGSGASSPVDTAVVTASAAAVADDAIERPEWAERLDQGRFAGQTVIVTGAGSGIGRATASRVAREGGRVIAVDISADRLAALAMALPQADIVPVTADITDDAGIVAIVTAAGDRIDGLANIAGIMDDMTPVGEVSDAVWKRVFAINVDGTMKLMRAVVPLMVARASGSIVNTASEAALRGSAAGVAYTASKHAVVGLTTSSAYMYGPSGVRVNAVAPGPTVTNIEGNFASVFGADRISVGMAAMPDPVESEALAASITFLLSNDGVNINGVVLPSDGGWSVA